MDHKPSVLVIDDERQIRRLLQVTLESNGYRVSTAATGEEGMVQVNMNRPDLVVLDLTLPDLDGTELLRRIREWATIPILILSARTSEQDIIKCLDSGADDYLVKPFRSGELLARVRAALRHRPSILPTNTFRQGAVTVDLDARAVSKEGEPVKLTSTEYSLLALFVRNAGRVLTHRYILEQVWGPAFAEESQYTRVYVRQLRKKLEDDPARPKLILTESGIGYRLVMEDDAA
jgi:two-component system KDP operon response regulator KdpE